VVLHRGLFLCLNHSSALAVLANLDCEVAAEMRRQRAAKRSRHGFAAEAAVGDRGEVGPRGIKQIVKLKLAVVVRDVGRYADMEVVAME
jgi:hypothetical protein